MSTTSDPVTRLGEGWCPTPSHGALRKEHSGGYCQHCDVWYRWEADRFTDLLTIEAVGYMPDGSRLRLTDTASGLTKADPYTQITMVETLLERLRNRMDEAARRYVDQRRQERAAP